MSQNLSDSEQLATLRDEILARNQIRSLQRRGETPPPSLTRRLRQPSLKALMKTLFDKTSIIADEDRVEFHAASAEIQRVAASVALICSKLDLVAPATQQANWSLTTKPFLCRGQKFDAQLGLPPHGNTPATGFLVGDSGRYLLTAKHVAVDDVGRLIPNLFCVFGYRMENNAAVRSFSRSDVFAISSLVEWGRGINEDWALVELEVPSPLAGLPLRTAGIPAVNDSVVAIGYPHGMPVKIGNGVIRDVSSTLYQADLDIGTGNSGSPVVSLNGNGEPVSVEGVVVSALDDLAPVDQQRCLVWVASVPSNKPEYWAGFVPIARVMASTVFTSTVLS